jgi:tetratricopeptide (TPR) repeat protein/transcriptional regulator with XRE-family HTH domain
VAAVAFSFAGMLRGLRTEAGLTQEELAQAAGLTSRAISYLERGEVATPRRETVRLLADALRLSGPARTGFEQAARGGGAMADRSTVRTLPRDVASFTGRQQELAALADAAERPGAAVNIYAIGGMAGVGKTAFAVHAAHQLANRFPGGQIFLPLHGHTPGQGPADPADALASLLATVGIPGARIPATSQARTALWREWAAGRRLLLILDDVASSGQVTPLLPECEGSLVLVTSRHHLPALDDATAISLDTMPPEHASELLVRLSGRPGLAPGDPAVAELTRLCGYLPLAIGMVARQLCHHPVWTPVGRAAELAAATHRLEDLTTENVSVAAAFDLSYAALTGDQQRLFRRLGLHPGPEVDAYAAAALDGTHLAAASRGLEDLYDEYLLSEATSGRYRLHDLIREHARALGVRLDQAEERERALDRLLAYYEHAASRANALIARQATPVPVSAGGAVPPAVPALAGAEQALAWARAERASLMACLDQAGSTSRHAWVIALTAGLSGLLECDGPWDDAIARHTAAIAAAEYLGDRLGLASAVNELGILRRRTGDCAAAAEAGQLALDLYRQLGSRLGEANALSSLGSARRATGDYAAGARADEEALAIYRDIGDRLGQARTLGNLGVALRATGDCLAAARAHDEALAIHRETGDRLGQARTHNDRGDVLRATGDYVAAARAHDEALAIYRETGQQLGQAQTLLFAAEVLRLTGDYPGAARDLEQALRIFRQIGNKTGEGNALHALGHTLRLTGNYPAAAPALEEALGIYRRMGSRLGEANSINEIGHVLRAIGDYAGAAEALEQALGICREIGNRDGEIEALNEMGALHRVRGELARAEECHQEALELALAIHSSWDEANARASLGRCALAGGRTADGESGLRKALAIFQRLGSAEASGVSAELDAL